MGAAIAAVAAASMLMRRRCCVVSNPVPMTKTEALFGLIFITMPLFAILYAYCKDLERLKINLEK